MLVDDCLKLICAEPQRCLRFDENESEESYCRHVLSGDENISLDFRVVSPKCQWKDPWLSVRDECVRAAKRGEARGQVASALASCGRLMDGSLPKDFWIGFKADSLSLAGSRAGPGLAGDVASAKLPLVSLDLGGCLLIDDDAVREISRSCRGTLRRLGLRNCRKLTDASVRTVADLPHLAEVDLGGDFNITSEGIRQHLATGSKKKEALVALGASGLNADDALLSALSTTSSFVRLGLGYGKFSSYRFTNVVFSWPHLEDIRVQWTKTFDDAALEALGRACVNLKAVDVVGTPVTVDGLRLLLIRRLRGVDESGGEEGRHLVWLNCRYTAGPKALLQKLASEYQESLQEGGCEMVLK